MSTKPYPSTLARPHSTARLVEAKRYPWGYHLEYRGPSLDALVAAGCITPCMRESLDQAKRGKKRFDEEGDTFTRSKMATKAVPDQVEIVRRISSSEEKALALPGVRDALAAAPVANVNSTSATSAAELQRYNRVVGRFQRPVEFFRTDNVLFVDWTLIRVRHVLDGECPTCLLAESKPSP